MLRRASVFLVIASTLVSVLYAWILLHYTGGEWILPLDDTYIYLQYARNLAHGHFMQFNAGDPSTSGATSFLYPILLAAGYVCGFRSDAALVFFAFLLNAAFLAASVVFVYRLLLRHFSPVVALASSLFFLATGAVTWGFHIGMEIGMMVFLVLLTVLWLQADIARDRIGGSAFALSLVALARPEGLLFGIVSAGMLLSLCRKQKMQRGLLLLLPLVAALVYVSVNYWIGGSFMPNSGRPKSPFYTPYFSIVFLLQHCSNFLLFVLKGLLAGTFTTNVLAPQNRIDDMTFFPPFSIVLFLVGALYCTVREWRERRAGAGLLLSLWFVLGLLFVSVASGKAHHNFRYLLPFLAAYSVFIIPGAWVFAESFAHNASVLSARAVRVTAGIVLIGFQLLTTVNFLLIFGQNAYGFLPYKKIGEWAHSKIPPGTRIAALDVGFIAYYSKLPIYDLFGLVTREMVESSFFYSDVMGSKYEFLQSMPASERPRFFFVQRSRFEEKGDEGHLAPLRSRLIFTIPSDSFPTIGLDPSIYEIDWSLAGRAASIHNPELLKLLETRKIVDELNVADLRSHAKHSYQYLPPLSGGFPANRIVTADSADGVRVQEGAWGVLYGESFEIRAAAGKPLRLVLRTNYIDNRLRVVVNGADAGEITTRTTDPKQWYELDLEIPANLVRDRNSIQVFGKFMSAHYWFLQ